MDAESEGQLPANYNHCEYTQNKWKNEIIVTRNLKNKNMHYTKDKKRAGYSTNKEKKTRMEDLRGHK